MPGSIGQDLLIFYFSKFFVVLGTEPRTMLMPAKYSNTELHIQP
jgi:hypothetical protein